jgi:hypothetical protein
MLKTISAIMLIVIGCMFSIQQAAASAINNSETKPKAKASKKPTKKTSKKKSAAVAAIVEVEPDIQGATNTNFDCELGNKLTTYHIPSDSLHMTLRWKNRLHQLTRVVTTTGAERFENITVGLVWIGIPAKSMLLDSKKGQQLANECMSAEQLKPAVIAAQVPATS